MTSKSTDQITKLVPKAKGLRKGILIASLSLAVLALALFTGLDSDSSGTLAEGHFQPTLSVTPDVTMAESLEEKAEIERRFESEATGIQAAAAPRQGDRPADLAVEVNPSFQEGILEGIYGPFGSYDVEVYNLYQKQTDAGYLQAFAGVLGSDPRQGVLVLMQTSANRLIELQERYVTPQLSGAVRIQEVVGDQISLVAEDGTAYLFDLQTREFVNLPGSPQ